MASTTIDRLDGLSSSTAIKGPCRVATTANITLSGTQTIDGVAVVAEDRVLVKDQTTASENGIWVVDTGAWRRAKDFAGNRDVKKGTRVFVTDGTLYSGYEFSVTASNPITIGTTSISFSGEGLLAFVTPQMYGALGDGVADDTAEIQAALDGALNVEFPSGTYRITAHLSLRGGHRIRMHPNALIRQYTADKSIFRAVGLNGIVIDCNNGTLYGEGSWSAAWTGNENHFDHAIHLENCTNCIVLDPRIKNCAHSGIAIMGGTGHRIIRPKIEGTHAYSTPLVSGNNFQNGIWLQHTSTYNAADKIYIDAPDVSGVAQGILSEFGSGTQPVEGIWIANANIHDIPGQHAFYLTHGHINIINPRMTDIALSGIKLQGGNANADIELVSVVGAAGKTIGSNFFEIVTTSPFTGIINNVYMQGIVKGANRAATIGRLARNIRIDVVGEDLTAGGIAVSDSDLHDIDITCRLKNCGLDGVAVTATSSDGIKIRPTIREPNTTGATANGEAGVRITSASAQVEIIDPDISDADGLMRYGIYNATAGSTVKVRGSVKISGAALTAVRAAATISEWPTEQTLSSATVDFTSGENVHSSQPQKRRVQSTSASNVTLWSRALADESTYTVQAIISGKLSGSAERRGVIASGVFYRDAAGSATIQGAVAEALDEASASFAGVYSLTTSGNNIVLLVNSGGVATYDWAATVIVTKVEG